ncbi:MAG: peptidase domain-containing ABC transporter, partial [Gammaproteobacteria bacterium]|nr:peptidase domain-containing ABC transporter [Gammaproteobacteria bacterium]
MKLPVVLQSNSTECGIACITMIANAHGRNCSIGQIRRDLGYARMGTSLRTLIDLARDVQLHARAVRLEPEEAGALRTPCVLLWGTQHFVVLKRISRRGWHLHDPAAGVRFYRNA